MGPALGVALCCATLPGVARAALADSLSSSPGSVEVVGGTPEPSRPDTLRKQPWHEQPRFVMARSLLIPGWGQVHNHAWFKAGLVAGVEGWLGWNIVQDQKELDRLLVELEDARADGDAARETAVANEYNAVLDQRLRRQWLLGAAIAYAMVDAFVDANFRGFDVEFRNDPALPAGSSPAGPTSGGGGLGVRLALRRNF